VLSESCGDYNGDAIFLQLRKILAVIHLFPLVLATQHWHRLKPLSTSPVSPMGANWPHYSFSAAFLFQAVLCKPLATPFYYRGFD
jgi:hypothetical protein